MAEKAAKRGYCGTCGGTRVMHSTPAATSLWESEDEGCWCPRCLAKPVEERCRAFVEGQKPQPVKAVDRQVARVGHDHPETAKVAAAAARLRSGTRRKEVYEIIQRAGARGMTDDEMERVTGRSHQSLSAVRNSLMGDGLVVDSGQRRRTQWGNAAIVWVVYGVQIQSRNTVANS